MAYGLLLPKTASCSKKVTVKAAEAQTMAGSQVAARCWRGRVLLLSYYVYAMPWAFPWLYRVLLLL